MNNSVVIFDMDGVVVDSLEEAYAVYEEFLKQFDIEGTRAEFNLLNGAKLSEIVSRLKENHELEPGAEILLADYAGRISSIYERVSLTEGVPETFRTLKSKGYALAIASSAERANIERVLRRFALADLVDVVVSGDDVEKAKPSPEIYDRVRKKHAAVAYIVVEDADNGIESALGAGMRVIFYNPQRRPSVQKPDMVARSIREIPVLLKQNGL